MGRPSTQNAYSQSAGLAGILAPVQEQRDPTNLDINYVLYRDWVNTTNNNYWKLMSFTSTSGTVLANWLQVEGTTNELHTLTGDTGGAISPTANNINVLGTAGQITVTGNPATSTLTLALAGGGTAIDSFIPDSGTSPVVPAGTGQVTMSGSGSITTVGGTNQLTTQLTGLTNHSLLVGSGTPTITNLGVATNGQLPIGSTGADPVLSTLTAGTGIAISNGAGSITISATGSGFNWTGNSGTFTAAINNGYFLTAASTVTLPASPSQGDAVAFVCDTTGSCVITANTGQSIRISNQISSVAGTATNSARGDSLSLVYRSGTTTWFAECSPNGGWTTA